MFFQRLMWIAWPAFIVAAILEMLVFAFIDPAELHWSGAALGWSREAIYTLSFFVFWIFTMLSSGFTTLLSMSPFEINRCPFSLENRPESCASGACKKAD